MVGKSFSPDSFTVSIIVDLVSTEGKNSTLQNIVLDVAAKTPLD